MYANLYFCEKVDADFSSTTPCRSLRRSLPSRRRKYDQISRGGHGVAEVSGLSPADK